MPSAPGSPAGPQWGLVNRKCRGCCGVDSGCRTAGPHACQHPPRHRAETGEPAATQERTHYGVPGSRADLPHGRRPRRATVNLTSAKNQPAMGLDTRYASTDLLSHPLGGLSQRTHKCSADPGTAQNRLTHGKAGHSPLTRTPSAGPRGAPVRPPATLSPASSVLRSLPPLSLDARPGWRTGGLPAGALRGRGQRQALGRASGSGGGGLRRHPGPPLYPPP